ncbi:IQ domain-containing protein H-like [Watersipora subatra]|uniref:IQ domain-containing protein H-like n=1 Tax=Watersipora subatra TaxID=2589382 RepID=UPI00355BE52D
MPKAIVPQKTLELQLQPGPPPATPNMISADYKSVQHRFPIQHGHTKEMSNEYMAFRQHYCLSWGPIISMLRLLEKLLQDYAVPIAFVNGDKLADLALEYELELQPTVPELLSILVNEEDVKNLLQSPGQRYRGSGGRSHAATRIQAQYRMYKQRKAYLEYRHRKWAAGVIALTWVMNVKMATMKRQLKMTRQVELDNFKERARVMARSWHKIKRSRRVIIHMPSLGYAQRVRDTINDLGTIQNAQMARLCDVKDPNVEVIYVSPVPVNDECMQYYTKLLALKPAVDSGNVEDQSELVDRYKIVIPEAIKSFPTHNMCLGTHLKYSPKALKRIRALIHGREAYIVSGMPHVDDLSVAEFLNVPILGPEPDVAHLYSTKSGSKRIFHSANVAVPPGEYDIYTLPQLYDSLAQLITDNLDVRTWLFKMDHEFDGRGTAYCHIADHLRCYMWARKQCEMYGDKWSKKWAQEPIFNKIHSELASILESHCIPLDKKVYGTWQIFLNAFLSRGGVVEATPPSDSVTALTVDMLIEPDGVISNVSSGDQIHAESYYRCWGLSTPQCSVEPDELNKASRRIAEACKSRGVIGHFVIDFVTFINARTGDQELWAVDLNLHYSDSTAMNTLVNFMTNGVFNTKDHLYTISPPVQESRRRQRRRRHQSVEDELPPTPDRYAVYSTKLRHTNLTVVHYSVFFQMCRAHGIGYDVKEKQGTIFTLVDSINRENLGMLTIGDNIQGAMATFARNLSCIHQEISAPNMQGLTNFKQAIEDLEMIIGTTIQNANEVEEES